MLASSYSCSHCTTGKHKSRPRIVAEASLLFLVSQSVNLVPSTQTVPTVYCIAKPQNHQHISPGIYINRLWLEQISIIQINKCYQGVCIMRSSSVIVWYKCCTKSEVPFIITAGWYQSRVWMNIKSMVIWGILHGILWHVMAAIWRSKMVQIIENAPFPSFFSFLSFS